MVQRVSRQHLVKRYLAVGQILPHEYATKRYRSNLINWGMLPFIIDKGELPFENGDYIFIPNIKKMIQDKQL